MIPKAKLILSTVILFGTTMISANAEDGIVHGRAIKKNANGGITTGVVTAGKGPDGVGIRGHKLVTDGQGDATRSGAAAYRGANGGTFGRGSTTTVSKDGAASFQGGFKGAGPDGGKIQSNGTYSRTAPGNGTATRNTDITGPKGDSYQGNTTWTAGKGVQHTGTCRDANGNTIPCK